MLKVLLLTNLYPTPQDPTRGVYNLHNFRALSRYCETRMVTPLPWWSRIGRPLDLFRCPEGDSTGIPASYPSYFSLPGVPSLHARGMYASLRSHVLRMRAAFPFDVILAAWAYPDAVAAAHLAREVGCPLVSMALGSDLNEIARQPSLRSQIVEAMGEAERVITVSGALKSVAVSLGVPPEKVKVQHNGVDGERFHIRTPDEVKALRSKFGLPVDRPVIGYVGNFKPEKGVEVLVEAMGELKRRWRTDVLLALVGSGPLEEGMRARTAALGLEDQIRFCGRRPHDEVPEWIAMSDAVCLPSFREGCPNVVLEALASGKPVVASEVGGVPELITPQANGVLVPAGEAGALATGLEAALSLTWDAERLRESVEFLSWDEFARTLHRTLEEAVWNWALRTGKALPDGSRHGMEAGSLSFL